MNIVRDNSIVGYLCLVGVIVGVQTACPATNYVAKHGSDANGGTDPITDAWLTIQYAVNTAASSDEIRVGEGTYVEAITFANGGPVTLTVRGGYNTNGWAWSPTNHPTIIKSTGSGTDTITINTYGNTLEGFTITGGKRGVYARALAGPDTRHYFTHCIVTNNADVGIYLDNDARNGIGIVNCLIANNGSHGVYIIVDNATLESYLYNCTIADNAGDGYYDAQNFHKTTRLRNCIIANNAGYGVRHDSNRGDRLDYLYNCCLYNNTKGSIWTLSTTYCMRAVTLETGNFAGYPDFVGGGDYHLQDGSVCVDMGADLSGSGVTNDLDGVARAAPFDLGCYQSSYSAATKYSQTYVDASRPNDSGAGTNSATAKKTIGAGAAITAGGGTCNVAAGTYNEQLILGLPNITVEGAAWDTTIVDGTGSVPVAVWIEGTNVTVKELTIMGGYIGVGSSTPQCVNSGIERCIVRNNASGVFPSSDSIHRRFIISHCAITNNSSYGIYLAGGKSAILVRNSLIANNTSHGSYLYNVDNSSYASFFYNCTIADNGGHGCYDNHNFQKTITYRNCIVSGNAGYGIWHAGTISSHYLGYSCLYGNATNYSGTKLVLESGIIEGDPLYEGSGSYKLADGSPCVDTGTDLSGSGVTNDILKVARTNAYDIGCYESPYSEATKYTAIYVDAARPDDSGAGTNWATAKKTIGSGLGITAENGTCYVKQGIYNTSVQIPPNVTLEGADRETVTINGSGSVVTMAETNGTVRGVTITGGANGVNVSVVSTDSVIDQCIIRGNGYGIYVGGSPNRLVTVTQCIITNNTIDGIYVRDKSSVIARNCLIANNTGNGIRIVSDNSPYKSYIDYCTFANNGGSGYIDENNWHMTTYITNCISFGNGGYGIRHAGTMRDDYIAYSCVYSNTSGDLSGADLIQQAGMITNQSPMFVENSYSLVRGSPCIDAAIDIGITNDVMGVARPIMVNRPVVTDGYDMGAIEANPPPMGTVITIR